MIDFYLSLVVEYGKSKIIGDVQFRKFSADVFMHLRILEDRSVWHFHLTAESDTVRQVWIRS